MRRQQCHKETEQAQGGKALEQVEAWEGAAAVAEGAAVALVETAFARAVVKRFVTSRDPRALRRNAPSAVRQ